MKTSAFALVFGIVFLVMGLMGLVPLFLVLYYVIKRGIGASEGPVVSRVQ